jgi:enoyl-CoA hydratase/carnithine racemase
MREDDMIQTKRIGRVLVVHIDRPHKRNAIDRPTALALNEALDTFEDDPGLWVAVLTGDGPAFSAGTDISDGTGGPVGRGGEYGIVRRRQVKPVIAAVEGLAFGGGLEIVLACDLVVAARGARFALPESRRGLVATSGALFTATRKLPYNVAVELMITGAELDATRAHALGLVNRLVDDGEAVAVALDVAADVCRSSPHSVLRTLTALRQLSEADDAAGWAASDEAMRRVKESADMTEGVTAFFERRDPRWTDTTPRLQEDTS